MLLSLNYVSNTLHGNFKLNYLQFNELLWKEKKKSFVANAVNVFVPVRSNNWIKIYVDKKEMRMHARALHTLEKARFPSLASFLSWWVEVSINSERH